MLGQKANTTAACGGIAPVDKVWWYMHIYCVLYFVFNRWSDRSRNSDSVGSLHRL